MSETIEIEVTVDGTRVRSISAESVPVPFGRGGGHRRDSRGHHVREGPGLESVLLASSDGGRSWSTKRPDWWQFFDHSLDPESSRARFFENQASMTSDVFGVLRDGTLLWAFTQNPAAMTGAETTRDCHILRSDAAAASPGTGRMGRPSTICPAIQTTLSYTALGATRWCLRSSRNRQV